MASLIGEDGREDFAQGYWVLFRRFIIAGTVLLILLLAISVGLPGWVAAAIAGASIGPIFLFEYWFTVVRPRQKSEEEET